MTMGIAAGLLLLGWVGGTFWFLYRHGAALTLAWREPMLRIPILVFESDDWGPPGKGQVEALDRLGKVLAAFRDQAGRPAQMTLGLVLAAPKKGVAPKDWDCGEAIETVGDPAYDSLCQTLARHAKCFPVQLHGWMHCWPPAVARAAAADGGVASTAMRVAEEGYHVLPPHLQTRWADCGSLPCRAIASDEIRGEASREARFFLEEVTGGSPVVVPPTFVWNDHAEQGWAEAGIQVLITPGERLETRDADGRPTGFGRRYYNGESLPTGLRTLVRDIYFEPSLGHQAGEVARILRQRWLEGRPALVETHRFNYEGEAAKESLGSLRALLEEVVESTPQVEFLRPMEILNRLDDPAVLVPGRLRPRIWVRRIWAQWRLRRPLILTGAILWLGLAWLVSFGAQKGGMVGEG